MTKKLSALTMALALFVCAALLPAPGAQAATAVTARLRPDVTIVIDGQKTVFYHVTGQQAHPVLYNGSTYLPLRAIGELMGRNVDWNSSTKTATLAGERTTPPTVGTPDANPGSASVKATLQNSFSVVVDGETRVFLDANGKRVYPLLCKGSIYLPIRAIGEIMGKTVGWDSATSTVTLGGGDDDDEVTDADSFSGNEPTPSPAPNPAPTPDPTPTPPSGSSTATISQAKARDIALKRVPGATAQHITKLKLDYDHGCWIYEVELVYNWAEYELEIDACTGAVLSYDCDHCDYDCDDHWHGGSGHHNSGCHH